MARHVVRLAIPCEGNRETIEEKLTLYGKDIASKTREAMVAYGFAPVPDGPEPTLEAEVEK